MARTGPSDVADAGPQGTGWLPSAAVTTTKPSGGASASFDALDSGLSDYLNDLGTKVGVQVLDVTRGVTYSFNAGKPFTVASAIKVPSSWRCSAGSRLARRSRRPPRPRS